MTLTPINIGVVGAGHLGRIHARLLATLDEFNLIGVADPRRDAAESAAVEVGCQAYGDYHEMLGRIDAAVVAAPTVLHHPIGVDLLSAGVHLLIEKPLTPVADQAKELVETANRQGLILQVGHVERFNPAWQAARSHLHQPKYIEASRTSGYTFRSTDVGVVLDLMIHDLELALSVIASPIVQVDALGVSVFGGHEDMAQARLRFENGCVANFTASRASFTAKRSMQVYCQRSFADIDFAAPATRVIHPNGSLLGREIDFAGLSPEEQSEVKEHLFAFYLPLEELTVEPGNAILNEQRDFAQSIVGQTSPQVAGEDGFRAIEAAELILQEIARHRWNGDTHGPAGPLATPAPATTPLPPELPAAPIRKAG